MTQMHAAITGGRFLTTSARPEDVYTRDELTD